MDLRIARSENLADVELVGLRAFLTEAFSGRFDDGHWANALPAIAGAWRDGGIW